MEGEKFILGMVMYTIKNENLREYVRKGIIKELKGKRLDQSCYEINCHGGKTGEIVAKIHEICKKAEEETNEHFYKEDPDGDNDFVTFYRATNSIYKENRDKIQRNPVVGE